MTTTLPPIPLQPQPLREPGRPSPPSWTERGPLEGAWLSFVDDSGRPQRALLPAESRTVTVGRSPEVDVPLTWDGQVSRLHAVLERLGGQWIVCDDGLSRNGTFVNDARVAGRARLRDRDRLRLGRTVLTFCSPGPGSDPRTLAGDAVPLRRRLTPAQVSVLAALCRPCRDDRYGVPATNAQIAKELVLSVEAVKTHLRSLFHTFGIEDLPQNAKRARLVELALAFGLVPEAAG